MNGGDLLVKIPTYTYYDLVESVFLDPKTGNWTVPVLKYSILPNHGPLYLRSDPLNHDKEYQNKVITYFYLKLTEKWLYRDDRYKTLHKYFEVKPEDNNGQVRLVNQNKINPIRLSENEHKAVIRYIETYFVTERFVKKILKEIVAKYHLKWYDLVENNQIVKDLFFKNIKGLIKMAIANLGTQ